MTNKKTGRQGPLRQYVTGAFLLAALLTLLPTPVASQGDSAVVQVGRVIDGDTVEVCCVFRDREKVRYTGINTPEIHHPMKRFEFFGKEAVRVTIEVLRRL